VRKESYFNFFIILICFYISLFGSSIFRPAESTSLIRLMATLTFSEFSIFCLALVDRAGVQ